MKSILIAIKPKWCAKIMNDEKTIEIRKTMPKCDLPIDVYIYCTKDEKYANLINRGGFLTGMVVAKFTLNKVEEIKTCERHNPELLKQSCLNANEFYDYLTKGKNFLGQVLGYAWHIDNLEIFDEPKELSEFKHWVFYKECSKCPYGKCDNDYGLCSQCCEIKPLAKAPQNYCYIETEN